MDDATFVRIEAGDELSESTDIVEANLEAMRDLFPEAFSEDGIDFEVLRQILGDEVAEGDEKYGLNWHGKKLARRIALSPSMGTLRPCPEESVDWDTTQNLMIEGDNLEVLKLLQKSYSGKVKLIYIDPPYNTGKDFVYKDDFRDNIKNYLELTGQTDEEGKRLSSNVESSGRFHTDWLNMMYPRLKLARNLLRDDGVIAISIDDHELENLRRLGDEVLGEENHLATFVRRRRLASGMRGNPVSPDHEYVVSYAKDLDSVLLYGTRPNIDDFPFEDDRGRYRSTDLSVGMSRDQRPNQHYPIVDPETGQSYLPSRERVWRFEPSTMQSHVEAGNIIWPGNVLHGEMSRPRFKTRYSEDPGLSRLNPVSTWISTKPESSDEVFVLNAGLNQEGTKELRALMGSQVLEYPKPVSLMVALVQLATRTGDLVVDFFAGSGTTAHGVWSATADDAELRRFILVQMPAPAEDTEYSTIAELTKERLRRAGLKVQSEHPDWDGDAGFRVFKLDSSNIRAWSPDRDDVEVSLLDYQQHLADDRSEEDILYEMLLKLGLDLCVLIEERDIGGVAVSSVGGGVLMTCLAESIPVDAIEALGTGIAGWLDELEPAGDTTVIFRDSAFENDVAKTNIAAILNQAGVASVRSI